MVIISLFFMDVNIFLVILFAIYKYIFVICALYLNIFLVKLLLL